MGAGLQRAALETIRTRSWTVGGEPLTGDQVVALYHAIPSRSAMGDAVSGLYGDRRTDRALAILKRARLVEYDPTTKLWRRRE